MGFLADLKVRTAAPRAKEYLLADGDGLYLRVRTTSKKDLLALPVAIRKLVGHTLDTAQRGEQHESRCDRRTGVEK